MTHDFRDIGSRIRILRKQRGMSQREFMDIAGVARTTLSRHERGDSEITLSAFIAYCVALETSPDELLGWRENPNPTN